MGQLDQKSQAKLDKVNGNLARVIRRAVTALPFDCLVSEGLRSIEQMKINYGKGRTAAECKAKDIEERYAQPKLAKVTWLAEPLKSKHGDGKAVDVYPMIDGKLDDGQSPERLQRFNMLYFAVMKEAAELNVRIRYGGDWDRDGKLREKGESDSPHFELDR